MVIFAIKILNLSPENRTYPFRVHDLYHFQLVLVRSRILVGSMHCYCSCCGINCGIPSSLGAIAVVVFLVLLPLDVITAGQQRVA